MSVYRSCCWPRCRRLYCPVYRCKIHIRRSCWYDLYRHCQESFICTSFPGAGALASIAGIPFLRETYAPIIQIRKLKKCKSDSEKAAAKLDILLESNKNKWQDLRDNLVRPIVLLTQSFVCFILSLYMALCVPTYLLDVVTNAFILI